MSNNKLKTKLSKEEIQLQFSQKFNYTVDLYLICATNLESLDSYYIIDEYLNLNNRAELSKSTFSNIKNYLIEFDIILTEFDVFKIISEIHGHLLDKIESSEDFDPEEKKRHIKSIWLNTVETFVNVLFKKSKRKLHLNNLNKIYSIINKGQQDKFYNKTTLYYIFRNVMDAYIDDEENKTLKDYYRY